MLSRPLLKMCLTTLLCLCSGLFTVVYADTKISFQDVQGVGTSDNTLQIKNMRVDFTIDDPVISGVRQTVSAYYNITFRFDPVTLQLVPLMETMSANCVTVPIRVMNSQTNTPLIGARVVINEMEKLTDVNGFVLFEGVTSGQQVISITANDFETSYQEINTQCGASPQLDIYLRPVAITNPDDGVDNGAGGEDVDTPTEPEPDPDTNTGGEVETPKPDDTPIVSENVPTLIRIQLNWGDSPRDLDAHLTGPELGLAASYSNDQDRFHVYFGNKTTSVAQLDTGEFSNTKPEVVTIFPPVGEKQLRAGTYRFMVQHFAGSGSIITANAEVRLQIGDGGEQIFTPTLEGANALSSASTDVWTVFELRVNTSGHVEVIPLQQYETGVNPSSVRSGNN
ncbi:hypothetical protein BegalDRAFT_1620 [Beggiatoa alba B18LD]|uniref:Cohesin domain-containing protein n=1 Tax=Beggiatoa alba B18LD TaxID=395493 RepID=I3CFV6_9GAMM|nr:hypothetical protein [Beggiatoa alba]EIJ42499.1 hypothetical protein BegalDRAFT_1620 [Beggiatoa alba B18LD]